MSLQLPLQPSGTLTLGDVVRYCYYHIFWRTRTYGPLVVLILLVSTIAPLNHMLAPSQAIGEHDWLATVIPLAWAAFMVLLPLWQAWAQYRKTPGLREPIRFQVGEEAVHCDATGSSGNVAWGRIDSVRETGSAFFIYHSPFMAWVLPKRWFRGGEAEMVEFRRLAAAGVAQPKLLKPPGWLSSKL
ncbi:MAG: YcxB family protein [Acidobacteria bacterium]|nr:YcxB family protein [Acidobacteriota bacterium]